MREFVADIGNTRIKIAEHSEAGLLQPEAVPLEFRREGLKEPTGWIIAGTNPQVRDRFADHLRCDGHKVSIIDDYRSLPLAVQVDAPQKVGIDRLLNAVALLKKIPSGTPFAIVDAGSAITVDFVDADHVFRGGAIMPGYRLMAKALNDYTARLPFITSFPEREPALPATNTIDAINAGLHFAVHGGINAIIERLAQSFGQLKVFIAGGDAPLLKKLDCRPEMAGPFLTLEGIRALLVYRR